MSIRRTDAMDVLDACSLKEWDTSYVGFIVDGAKWLVDNTDIKLVGIDYLSVASYDYLIPSHLVFLKDRRRSRAERPPSVTDTSIAERFRFAAGAAAIAAARGRAAQFLERFFALLLRSLHLFLLLLLCHPPSSSPSRASTHHSVEDMCFPERKWGWLVRTTSFLVKHSWSSVWEETTTRREPNHREMTSSYLSERALKSNRDASIFAILEFGSLLSDRMFVDALDVQMYDEHHSTGHYSLSLSKTIHETDYEYNPYAKEFGISIDSKLVSDWIIFIMAVHLL
ncbi:hypothetical protein JHK87_024812 [Glycine soja]|nr:hypothetical protein JHK87_024812 [Glycine soja]